MRIRVEKRYRKVSLYRHGIGSPVCYVACYSDGKVTIAADVLPCVKVSHDQAKRFLQKALAMIEADEAARKAKSK